MLEEGGASMSDVNIRELAERILEVLRPQVKDSWEARRQRVEAVLNQVLRPPYDLKFLPKS